MKVISKTDYNITLSFSRDEATILMSELILSIGDKINPSTIGEKLTSMLVDYYLKEN